MSDGGSDSDGAESAEAAAESAEAAGSPCPRCGTQMLRRHCKYVCPQHGVVYDCSDTFY